MVRRIRLSERGLFSMTASLKVKNDIWQMIFSYKDSAGKWKQKSESTGLPERGNKRRAEAMMKERLAVLEKQTSTMLESRDLIFTDEMKRWLDDVMAFKVRGNTLNQYLNVWKKHIRAYEPFQNLPLGKITSKLLQEYVNAKMKYGLAPETIRKHHANIHKFLDYCWRLEMIPANPADRIELPPRNRHQHGQVYTAEQLQQLIQLFRGDPLETLILITATYGVRRSEICGLKWEAIDFEHNCLYIRHTAIVDCGKVVYSDATKSESSCRRLPLTPTVAQHLRSMKRKQAENQMLIGAAYKRDGFVCCWPDGSPVLPEYATRHYREVIAAHGFPFVALRNLRDTAATLLHQEGFDAKSIQGLLGHADASTTANIYIHSATDDLVSMAAMMDKLTCSKQRTG